MKILSKIQIALLLALVLGGCAGNAGEVTPTLVPTPMTVEKPVYTVERGEVTEIVQLNGRVTPAQQQELFFRSDGFVKEVLIKSGDTVSEGEVLARLDEPERYQAEVAAAELAYEQAKLDLEQTRLDAPILAAQAKVSVQEALVALEKAKNERLAMKYPHITDGLTLEKLRGELESAKNALDDAQSAFDDVYGRPEGDAYRQEVLQRLLNTRTTHYRALANLNWAEGKATPAELELADAKVALAQANYDKSVAEEARWSEDGGASGINLAELAVTNAEARLAMARKSQESIELRAPFGGQVLSLGIAPGSQVRAFQAVLTLADPAELEIAAVPTAENLTKLGIGQAAVIRLSSRQGQDLAAKITGLPLAVSSATDGASRDMTVHFALEDGGTPLTLGDAAIIMVTIDTRTDVLWLPPAAIRSFQGQSFVFVESGGVQRRVNVTLGLQAANRVEVLSGLEEGQVVAGQ